MNYQDQSRKRIVLAALVGSILLGGTFSVQAQNVENNAQETCQQKMAQRMELREKKRNEAMEKRFNVLQQRLQLTEKQQADWKRFNEALRSTMAPKKEKGNAHAKAGATVLERLARKEAWMQERTKVVTQQRKAVEQFYASLSASQKTAFDVSFFDSWQRKRSH